MTTRLKTIMNLTLAVGLLSLCSFGDPKVKKFNSGRCVGAKYCSVCVNCSRCKHCGIDGVCGVCSPESFEEKPKPVTKKTTKSNSQSTQPKKTTQPTKH